MTNRIFVLIASLYGAAGVALSAAAAHTGGANIHTAAAFLLAHAPAFLALGLLGGKGPLRIAGWVLFAGLTLFAGDLLMRDYAGTRLFPMAAPTGGTLMIFGWLAIGAAAFFRNSD